MRMAFFKRRIRGIRSGFGVNILPDSGWQNAKSEQSDEKRK
jgi:hypothetical protein